MKKEQVIQNKINYYLTRIIELKKATNHDYTKAIEQYKKMIIKELKEL